MTPLERILTERPAFHALETEIQRQFAPGESCLPDAEARRLTGGGATCYGIGEDVLRFLADTVSPGWRTLETGAGCSTLVLALRGAHHMAITPSATEIQAIRDYAAEAGIPLDHVTFAAQPSERCLPHLEAADLDLVLLDGKHAFPWPMVDWFFTADRLKEGGWLLLDDAQMRSVAVLADFLNADPAWQQEQDFSGKTLAFRKVRPRALDVAWHMQPWNLAPLDGSRPSLATRAWRRLARLLRQS